MVALQWLCPGSNPSWIQDYARAKALLAQYNLSALVSTPVWCPRSSASFSISQLGSAGGEEGPEKGVGSRIKAGEGAPERLTTEVGRAWLVPNSTEAKVVPLNRAEPLSWSGAKRVHGAWEVPLLSCPAQSPISGASRP